MSPLSTSFEFKVVRVLSPPTATGYVLLVKSSLPEQPVVMKIYDPRYIRSRFFSWTPELESQAAEHREEAHTDPSEPLYEPLDDVKHLEWEEYWYRRCKKKLSL
ncbi:hypothetical protein AAF712_015590 [Marasmius tenuissimus]|uniref:Uncharacterized protein n=1 Tax=Marasmius tenuissimus TaxID=585030 RepID=A0ABR2Z8T4_9AGAR